MQMGGPLGYAWQATVDIIAFLGIFSLLLVYLMRLGTDHLMPTYVEVHAPPVGRRPLGARRATGFAMVAILLTSLHRPPPGREFAGFTPERGNFLNTAPDRMWLGFMQYLSEKSFASGTGQIFDYADGTSPGTPPGWQFASFPIRYAHRREAYTRLRSADPRRAAPAAGPAPAAAPAAPSPRGHRALAEPRPRVSLTKPREFAARRRWILSGRAAVTECGLAGNGGPAALRNSSFPGFPRRTRLNRPAWQAMSCALRYGWGRFPPRTWRTRVWFDVVVLVVLAFFGLRGAIQGVIFQLAGIAGIGLCVACAGTSAQARRAAHQRAAPFNQWIVLFGTYLVCTFVAFSFARGLNSWTEEAQLGDLNRHLGFLFGVVKGSSCASS